MSILKVARLGNPILRKTASEVPRGKIPSAAIQQLIDDMIDTMREYDGVGLAAPQVHQSLRIAVVESLSNPRYPAARDIPLTVLINPKFSRISKEMTEGWESCLSIDDLSGKVPRAKELKVSAFDRTGKKFLIEAAGFLAVVLQHEMDHLNGMVYLDRMKDLKTLAHIKEHIKYWEQK